MFTKVLIKKSWIFLFQVSERNPQRQNGIEKKIYTLKISARKSFKHQLTNKSNHYYSERTKNPPLNQQTLLCIAKYRSERIRVLFTEIKDNGIRFHFPFIPYLLFKWSHISNRLKQILNNVQTVHANNLFIKCKCFWKRGINFFLKISYTECC